MGLSLIPSKAFRSRTLSAFSSKTFAKSRASSTAERTFTKPTRLHSSNPPSPVSTPLVPPVPDPPERPDPSTVVATAAAPRGLGRVLRRGSRRPPRLKDVDAPNLLRYLDTFSFETVASDSVVNQLSERLSSDVVLLTALVDILCHPTNSFDVGEEAARDRVSSAWIVSCLLRYSGNGVKDALAKQPSLIKRMAQVFSDAKQGSLDAAHVQCILEIIRSQLQTHARLTVAALPLREVFVPALVKHIDLQPVVEFLPRLVGTRAFPSRGRATALLPAHKKALAALAAAKVIDRLADAFVKVSADVIDAGSHTSSSSPSSSTDGALLRESLSSTAVAYNTNNNNNDNNTNHFVAVVVDATLAAKARSTANVNDLLHRDALSAACEAMGEIAARASCLYLKPEDPDERLDGVFSSNGLGIVTASVFNDAKKYLDPFYTPWPFVRVLEKAVADVEFLYEDDEDHNDVDQFSFRKSHPQHGHGHGAGHQEKDEMILLPPLQMFLHVLRTWRETDPAYRTSLLVSEQPDVSTLGNALAPVLPRLAAMLSRTPTNKPGKPSLVQLAIVDLLHDAASVFDSPECRRELLAHDVTRGVCDGMRLFQGNDMFVTSASHFLAYVFDLVDDVDRAEQVDAVRQLVNDHLQANYAATPLTNALKQYTRSHPQEQTTPDVVSPDGNGNDDPNDSGEWQALCLVARRHRQSGPVLRRRKSESELAAAGEDLPHELYVMTHLELAKNAGIHTAPPDDDFVSQAVDAGVSQRSRGQLTSIQV